MSSEETYSYKMHAHVPRNAQIGRFIYDRGLDMPPRTSDLYSSREAVETHRELRIPVQGDAATLCVHGGLEAYVVLPSSSSSSILWSFRRWYSFPRTVMWRSGTYVYRSVWCTMMSFGIGEESRRMDLMLTHRT